MPNSPFSEEIEGREESEDFSEIQKLIALKRYEQPHQGFENYTENFLHQFQQRQRAELLNTSAHSLFFERLQTWAEGFLSPRIGFGGALAGTAALACILGVSAVAFLKSINSNEPSQQGTQLAQSDSIQQPILPTAETFLKEGTVPADAGLPYQALQASNSFNKNDLRGYSAPPRRVLPGNRGLARYSAADRARIRDMRRQNLQNRLNQLAQGREQGASANSFNNRSASQASEPVQAMGARQGQPSVVPATYSVPDEQPLWQF